MPRDGLVKEPTNTWSNFGFIIVGLIIAWQMTWDDSLKKNANIFTRSDFMSILFSSLVIFLGPASMAMHASYTWFGILLDSLSMTLVVSFMVAYSIQRYFFSTNSNYFLGVFLFIIFICELAESIRTAVPIIVSLHNVLISIGLILTVIVEVLIVFYRKSNIEKGWGIAALTTFLLSFLIWNLSKDNGLLCSPRSWFQGHALWHLLDAVALYFLFRYYMSEHNSDQCNLLEELK